MSFRLNRSGSFRENNENFLNFKFHFAEQKVASPCNYSKSSLFYSCSFSETHCSSHHDAGEVRLGWEALRCRVQEFRVAARGCFDLVEGLETNQKNGEECEFLLARDRFVDIPVVLRNFNDVCLVMPGLMSQQTIRDFTNAAELWPHQNSADWSASNSIDKSLISSRGSKKICKSVFLVLI